MRSVLAACLLVGLCALPARGDVVHLRGGRRLVGRVTESGEDVLVQLGGGSVTFPRSRVERIERVELPTDRVRRVASTVDRSDAAALATLAEQASAEGLDDLAAELFTGALAATVPVDSDIAARHRVWHVRQRVPDENDVAAARLTEEFGAGGKLLRTRHWRIIHDAPTESVRIRAEMLEAAWREFHALAERLGAAPGLVDDRLEAMVFADHGRWAAATGLAPEALKGLDGIYVGHTRRMLLYDTGTSPESRRALERSERRIADVDALLVGLEARPQDAATRAELERLTQARRELTEHRSALVDWWRRETLSTTTHEACHQIAFATGLCRSDQPLWLIEGLATLFEPTERERFLVTAPNAGRLRDVREAWGDGRGADLRRIVGGETFDSAARHGDVSETALAYAEAWSLVHFLVTQRRAAFSVYLAAPRTGKGGESRRLERFAEAFGDDLDTLERDWQRHVQRL